MLRDTVDEVLVCCHQCIGHMGPWHGQRLIGHSLHQGLMDYSLLVHVTSVTGRSGMVPQKERRPLGLVLLVSRLKQKRFRLGLFGWAAGCCSTTFEAPLPMRREIQWMVPTS